MKTRLSLLIIALSTSRLLAIDVIPSANPPAAAEASAPTPEAVLATQVSEIAASTTMNRATKQKLIASAVRLAITAAIEGVKDSGQALEIATQLAAAAAKAAPKFADTITAAGASVPAFAGLDGAVAALRSAVKSGAESAGDGANDAGTPGGRAPTPTAQFGGNTNGFATSPSSPN